MWRLVEDALGSEVAAALAVATVLGGLWARYKWLRR